MNRVTKIKRAIFRLSCEEFAKVSLYMETRQRALQKIDEEEDRVHCEHMMELEIGTEVRPLRGSDTGKVGKITGNDSEYIHVTIDGGRETSYHPSALEEATG